MTHSRWRPVSLIWLVVLLLLVMAAQTQAVSTTLVINEIDYDQPSTDTAEFLELKNVSGIEINLDLYTVELINGTGGGAAPYTPLIDLPAVNLAAGDYYVICANAATVANCDLDVAPSERRPRCNWVEIIRFAGGCCEL
jgi:hypothetical protein